MHHFDRDTPAPMLVRDLVSESWHDHLSDDVLDLPGDCAVGDDTLKAVEAADALLELCRDLYPGERAEIMAAVAHQALVYLHG